MPIVVSLEPRKARPTLYCAVGSLSFSSSGHLIFLRMPSPCTGEDLARELPGGDLIAAGLRDLALGVESVEALLVSIGAPRLARLGYHVPNPFPDPERRLYERLCTQNPFTAHSRYNSLIRRLVSFERAAECAS